MLNSSAMFYYSYLLFSNLVLATGENVLGFSDCAAKIAIFSQDKCTYIIDSSGSNVFSTMAKAGITWISLNSSFKLEDTFHHFCTPDLYIVVINEMQQYHRFLLLFYSSSFWNPRAKFFVVSTADGSVDEIMTASWKFYAINVAVLNRTGKVYTYFPFEAGKCGNDVHVREVQDCANASKLSIKKIFTDKLPRFAFKHCPLRVMPLHVVPHVMNLQDEKSPGIEVFLIRELARRSQLRLQYVNNKFTTWGEKLLHGPYTLMYRAMLENKADVMLGMILANDSYYADFDSSICYNEDNAIFFVPVALPVAAWRSFIMIFDKVVWTVLMVSVLVMSATWWTIGSVTENSEGYNNIVNCFFR